MTILSQLSCHVLAILSSWSCPGLSVRLTSLDWPALAVSCLRSRPGCPVMAVCRICPVLVALSQLSLSCPSCHFLAVCPAMVVLSCLSFITVLLYLSCHACPATVVLSQLPTPAGLSHLSCPRYLSQHSCPLVFLSPRHVLTVFPVLDAKLSCLCCHVLGILFSLSVQSDLSRLTFLANRPGLTCSSCPVLTIMLSCAGVSATVVVSRLSCPSQPCHAVMFWPSSFLCLVHADMIRRIFPANLSRLTCLSCPIQAILSQPSCPGCPVCGCPVKVVLSQLSCPNENISG
jgi:hypothetical protein